MENSQDKAVRRMKTYIEKHIKEPITASILAREAGYSQFHAARIFKEQVGKTPFEYIRERRLTNAAFMLRGGGVKVTDVAFDFVFDSHEGFTRAFTSAFGIAPKRFAKLFSGAPKPSGWLIPFRVRPKNETEEKIMSNTAIVFTQIVERPARKLLIRHSKAAEHYFQYCEEFECTEEGSGATLPWTVLCGIKEALYEPVGVWLPDNMRGGNGVYAQGVEVPANYSGKIPDGFELINLEPCKMLIFQGEPYDDEKFDEAIAALWERIKKFNPEVYGYEYADEIAPRMQLAPLGWRGYIEMRPVREISKK